MIWHLTITQDDVLWKFATISVHVQLHVWMWSASKKFTKEWRWGNKYVHKIAICGFALDEKCMCESECFCKYPSMSCQCVKQSMQIRWESLFIISLATLSLKDATIPCECASQLWHPNYWLLLGTQLTNTCVSTLDISWSLYLTHIICPRVYSGECDFSYFVFVLIVNPSLAFDV